MKRNLRKAAEALKALTEFLDGIANTEEDYNAIEKLQEVAEFLERLEKSL